MASAGFGLLVCAEILTRSASTPLVCGAMVYIVGGSARLFKQALSLPQGDIILLQIPTCAIMSAIIHGFGSNEVTCYTPGAVV